MAKQQNPRSDRKPELSNKTKVSQDSIIYDLEAHLEQHRIDGRKMAYINADGTTTPIE